MFLTERDNRIGKGQICRKSGEVIRKCEPLFGHISPLFRSIFTSLMHFSIFQVKQVILRRNPLKWLKAVR